MGTIPGRMSLFFASAERVPNHLPHPTSPSVLLSAVRYTYDVLFRAALGMDARSLDAETGEACPTFDALQDMTACLSRLILDPLSQ